MSILENRPIRAVAIAAISLFIVAGAALAANGHPLVLSTPSDSASPSAALDTSSPVASDTSMPSAVVTVPPVGDETQPPDLDGDRSAAPAASQTPDIDKTQPPDLDGDRTAAPSSGDKDGDKGSGGNQGSGGDEGSGGSGGGGNG